MSSATGIPPPPLSGRTVNSFAYKTIKDRLPVILTKVLDDLCRKRKRLIEELGDDAGEEVTFIAGALSKLKYEMQTDKPLTVLRDDDEDVSDWNSALAIECLRAPSGGGRARWFDSPWLFVECYMYRRVFSSFLNTTHLATLDPFADAKKRALTSCSDAAVKLFKHLRRVIQLAKGEINEAGEKQSGSGPNGKGIILASPSCPPLSLAALKQFTRELFLLCLWGNKCDLSISAGDDNNAIGGGETNPLEQLRQWDKNLLVDDFDKLWQLLMTSNGRGNNDFESRGLVIDWVVDNAGFEFFTDLLLAEFLMRMHFATEIRFHVKRIPWFVSDVTSADVKSTVAWLKTLAPPLPDNPRDILKMEEDDDYFIASFAATCAFHFRTSMPWSIEKHDFWTLPYAYRQGVGKGRDRPSNDDANDDRDTNEDQGRPGMRAVAPDLYATLSSSDLVVFKGDLNYRKLVGDLDWKRTTPFAEALGDFQPTNLLALRTLKADVVTGLADGVAHKLDEECPDWMTNGEYAVMQMC